MKWQNPGHEYDEMYNEICKKKAFYLFGAGDYGTQFIHLIKDEISILGYIDNMSSKQGKVINGLRCYSMEEIDLTKDIGIIVTMSQIARVGIYEQLSRVGLRYRVDFFVIEEFLSVYYVYEKNEVYFSSISFLPSTACNLRCKNCLNFNPFAPKFYVREWGDLVDDVDTFFSCVDHIMLFHVSGGEPFLFKQIAELIEYIDKNYGDRIDTLRTVTNGTQIPSDETLEILSKCNVEVTVDDYRDAVPQYDEQFRALIDMLKKYKIKYCINKADYWIDLAPERTDYSDKSEKWLIEHRNECSQSWQELRDKKLYNCNYAAYATVAGIAGEQDDEETFDLSNFDNLRKKELIEFRLGYSSKGYTRFCVKCRGFTSSNPIDKIPAEQIMINQNAVFKI